VLGEYFKTSFHRRKWRHAYIAEAFEPLFEGVENAPEDRCMGEWDPPGELIPGSGVIKALAILTPWDRPSAPIESEDSKVRWISTAPKPRWTEIGIYFLDRDISMTFPSGSEPNGFIAHEHLGDGRFVHIVHLTIDPPVLPSPQRGGLGLFAGKRPADSANANAALALASAPDGLRLLFDYRAEVGESAIERLEHRLSERNGGPGNAG
jgi:hypothetical protein